VPVRKKNTSFTERRKVGLDQAIDEERNDSYLCKLQWRADGWEPRKVTHGLWAGRRGAGAEGTEVGGRHEQRAGVGGI
jgi:hypothetical protein